MAAVQGLTAEQVQTSLAVHGRNAMPQPRRPSSLRRFVGQLLHFFALMLWGAAALALIAGMPQLGVAIIAVVILNAVFAFVQEGRADRAAERLRSLLPTSATVIRDGKRREIDAADVVVGDLIALDPGDRIPADGSIVRATALSLDTSMLTGESRPSHAIPDDPVFAGTFVVEGEGTAVMSAVGKNTRLAAISQLTTLTPKPETPLSKELRRVVRMIAAIALSVGAVFFGITLLLGNPPSDGFIFAVGVTVALVPEALLPTVTLTLAWGAEQMARRQVLVRDLEAVQTLGSTTFICTDKTGTLTRNEMTVVAAWTPDASARVDVPGYTPEAEVFISPASGELSMRHMAEIAVGCSDGYVIPVGAEWHAHGDPMEAAIDAFALRLGLNTDAVRLADVGGHRFPFDPRRRRMSVVCGELVQVKGAPDSVLALCGNADGAEAVVAEMSSRGLRVLAIAERRVSGPLPPAVEQVEQDLILLGLMGLEDPPRADVRQALEDCRAAGIKVAVVTGDHPGTASAIATEVGLRKETDPVFEGKDLPQDEALLGALLDHTGVVVARVSPEDKLRIARALRARGHVVAMTGDGVNDVPALHEANIGIAMGKSGSDAAREAAELVLLDDNFASIVAGIEQGRTTYINIRRFLTYHLTDNVAELTPFVIWALSGGRIPLALGVLQILALDIGTDTFSAVALGAEPPARRLLKGPPVSGRLLNHTVLRRAFGVLGPTEALMSMLAFLLTFVALGWRPGQEFPGGDALLAASGAAFITVVFAQVANGFACRSSTLWPGRLGWLTNRLLIPATAVGLAFSLSILLIPPVASVFGQSTPTPIGWLIAGLAPAALLAADAADKWFRRRSLAHRAPDSPHKLQSGSD
ncbi:MAG: cation-transporting P-type ATPase [Actinomycetota bacterium]|nr:cation-transporting P-type ATPase [Actinomycetota bacterium]